MAFAKDFTAQLCCTRGWTDWCDLGGLSDVLNCESCRFADFIVFLSLLGLWHMYQFRKQNIKQSTPFTIELTHSIDCGDLTELKSIEKSIARQISNWESIWLLSDCAVRISNDPVENHTTAKCCSHRLIFNQCHFRQRYKTGNRQTQMPC